MPGPPPAVAATRVAVRRMLASLPTGTVLVACSGGPDSMALAAAVAFEAPRQGRAAGAVVVDHGLQEDSAAVAAQAADSCLRLGLAPVEVRSVKVATGSGGPGPEAAARAARYDALTAAATDSGAVRVLLGHTRDDQAEQVLLGLARGSGTRSLAGMPRTRGLFARPLLDLPRAVTTAACAAQDLTVWEDPHNLDRRYARVRAREAVAATEAALGPGVAAALARSAGLLAADAEALDQWAGRVVADLGGSPWTLATLGPVAELPVAVRRRVWRMLASAHGSRGGDLSAVHLDALDRLLSDWRGQGPVSLPGGLSAQRAAGILRIGPHRPASSG